MHFSLPWEEAEGWIALKLEIAQKVVLQNSYVGHPDAFESGKRDERSEILDAEDTCIPFDYWMFHNSLKNQKGRDFDQ